MAQFTVGQSITTDEPRIAVDAGLAVGAHRFTLMVLDQAGLRSRVADEVTVRVQRLVVPERPDVVLPERPVLVDPVITPVRPVRRPQPTPRRPR